MNDLPTNQMNKETKSKKASLYIILVSLAFAIAMLISSAIFADNGYSKNINFLLIAIWFVPFFYFIKVKQQSSN